MLKLKIAAILLLLLLAYRAGRRTASGETLARALDSRWSVFGVAAVTFLVLWYTWGAWSPIPVVHDEMAYVLQSHIFARGRWVLPSPAIPAFWEQPYILLQPGVAGKYFPGHPLLLTLGAMVGWDALVPLLLQSASAALLFVLVRRVASGGVALLTWVLWLTSPLVIRFGPSFFSQATTTVCWLAGWYALLEWRAERRLRWLLAVAFFTGWCAITRPLTGVAYAIPIGLVVLYDVVTTRRWRDLALAFAMGVAVIAILPLWSAMTTGDWRLSPLMLYTRQYMPYDLPGFGLITTPPTRPITWDMARLNDNFSSWHVDYFPRTLPSTLSIRAQWLASHMWGESANVLAVVAFVGLFTLSAPVAFAVASSVFLLLVYLSFATSPSWSLYYYESGPAYAYLTAAGMAWVAARIGRPRGVAPSAPFSWRSPRWAGALAVGAAAFLLVSDGAVRPLRQYHVHNHRSIAAIEGVRAAIPDARAVVFVRYAPNHDANVTWVRNSADPTAERVWAVRDLGAAENARLMALTPDRTAYLFDEASWSLERYPVRSTAAR